VLCPFAIGQSGNARIFARMNRHKSQPGRKTGLRKSFQCRAFVVSQRFWNADQHTDYAFFTGRTAHRAVVAVNNHEPHVSDTL
jgi:hypothetical protein